MKLNAQVNLSSLTKRVWTQGQFFKIFCAIMFGGICLFSLSLLIFGFDRWIYLFHIFIDANDYFMDFFNPIYWSQFKNIYGLWDYSNYLAFPYLIFMLFSYIIPIDVLATHPVIIRSSVYGIISLSVFLIFSLVPLVILIFKNKIGALKEKSIFSILIIFSSPLIYSVERGNIIFIALFCMMFFIFYYDSKKLYLKNLSILFLAIAIAIKIYPAAVGILLLKDKRFKDICVLGIYVFCLLFLPFFHYNGVADIKLFINNTSRLSKYCLELGFGYSLNISNTLRMLVYMLTEKEFISLNIIFHYISYLVLLVGIFTSYFTVRKWKTIAIVCLLMILVPSISWTYVLLLMIAPLILFLNDKDNKNFKDLIYLILFCLMFMLNIPTEVPIFMPDGYPVLMDNFCARLSCLVMFAMLCYDGIKDYIRFKKNYEQ